MWPASLGAGFGSHGLLTGVTVGGLAAVVGTGVAGADSTCRDFGHPCDGDQTCCSSLICTNSGPGAAQCACPQGMFLCADGTCAACCTDSDCPSTTCGTGSCQDGICSLPPIAGCCQSAGDCPAPSDPCQQAECVSNRCAVVNINEGNACSSTNQCFQTYVCLSGTCTGQDPVLCDLQVDCVTFSCDPATGTCQAGTCQITCGGNTPTLCSGANGHQSCCFSQDFCVTQYGVGCPSGDSILCPSPESGGVPTTCCPFNSACINGTCQ